MSAAARRLVDEWIRPHGVRDVRVLEAMARIPRHLFVEDALQVRAYMDDALPIGHGQTISKPSTVARMTEALLLKPGARVLDVGTGSGYQAAVLALLASRVFSIERIAPLVVRAQRTLTTLGLHGVEIRLGDGALGWPEAAPFDGILVAAAAETVPPALLEQLAAGGSLVLPLRGSAGQHLLRVTRHGEAEWEQEVLEPCRFVPLVAGA